MHASIHITGYGLRMPLYMPLSVIVKGKEAAVNMRRIRSFMVWISPFAENEIGYLSFSLPFYGGSIAIWQLEQ